MLVMLFETQCRLQQIIFNSIEHYKHLPVEHLHFSTLQHYKHNTK